MGAGSKREGAGGLGAGGAYITFGTLYYSVNMERVLFPGESSNASSVTAYKYTYKTYLVKAFNLYSDYKSPISI